MITVRNEIKYFIDPVDAIKLQKRLKNFMVLDSNTVGSGYVVKSLYFDDFWNGDYHSKLAGIENRKKLRIRTYGESEIYKLEIKRKYGNQQRKESRIIDRSLCESLINGRYDVLYGGDEWLASTISMMKSRLYRPVTLIVYNRTAYVYPIFDVRITFDREVTAATPNGLFCKGITGEKMTNKVILEIKYSGGFPDFLTYLFEDCDLTQLAISKYCFGRESQTSICL